VRTFVAVALAPRVSTEAHKFSAESHEAFVGGHSGVIIVSHRLPLLLPLRSAETHETLRVRLLLHIDVFICTEGHQQWNRYDKYKSSRQ